MKALPEVVVPIVSTPQKSRTRVAVVACGLVFVLTGMGGWFWYKSRHVSVPLLSAAVAIDKDGQRVSLPAESPLLRLLPDSRVLSSAGAAGQLLAKGQANWLAAGTIPQATPEYQDMVRTALLDLNTLLLPDGATVAGWPQRWRYVWPRDASMIAVALSRTRHSSDALLIMQFLQRHLPPDGGV